MLYYYLLIIYPLLAVDSMVLKFETNSNASQFTDLENLIGSFHTYTPSSSILFVRDMGLTDGQKKLLNRYKNIHTIYFNDQQSEDVEKVNVDHEFLLINDTLYNRHNQGRYRFISLIQKQFYLAIVIPFIEAQRNKIDTKNIYTPCRERSNSIDLIFYSNQKNITHFNYSNQCYQNIHYISVELTDKENPYPVGCAHMWKKLFNSSFSLRSRGYTHFFLMEPDTHPIRPYWLDAIVEQITNGHSRESYLITKWWIIGSIYRGTISIGEWFLHINGNALYHLTYDFIEFIETVSIEYPYGSPQSVGYDIDLFFYLSKHIDQAKTYWHKFQFTDFIQNCWHTGCNYTDQEFLFNNPNTYLIHGYEVSENRHEVVYPLKRIFFIVLLAVICLISRRRFHFLRRLFSYLR